MHVLNRKCASHTKQTRGKRELNIKQMCLLEVCHTVSLSMRALYALFHGLYQLTTLGVECMQKIITYYTVCTCHREKGLLYDTKKVVKALKYSSNIRWNITIAENSLYLPIEYI